MVKKYRQEVKLSNENYEFIKSLKEKEKTTFNEIINSMINLYRENPKHTNISRVKKSEKQSHRIYVTLTDTEYNFLKIQAIEHGFSSATKEVIFRLTNSMYDEKIFSNTDMNILLDALNNINKIGRNINELIRILKEKSNAKININIDRLGDLLTDIYSFIKLIDKEITSYRTEQKNRLV
ncbi:hypothetical protein [Campylobacter fetus]|uniref:hypothetical protein n=1 Tax=Campylobacter fetus TaxID=196 RepID=UPI0003E369AB|nr:hypothetical protein [Campylobacter fetus]OCS21529.1 hypothetical protein CFVI97532_09290 [Campylobacter fetus subsp. venerealis cfvi97/532]CDF65964.1 hypothetical protein CSG_c630 [Campylobacter fetus subsp. venerealis str. 84-112]